MGWPDQTAELRQFYPTSVLVTGYDIIFFWVARMIFMGLDFQKEIPFRHVFIHGLVRDSQGRKMSKSLGNGIDPLEVIEQYGADTLRFTLVTGNTPGNDMRFYWERVESSRNFANKIWNASRFVMMNLEGFDPKAAPGEFTLADRWILSRYAHTVADVTENLERFELGEAARASYEFIWNEFCDWYIELAKSRLYDKVNCPAGAREGTLGYKVNCPAGAREGTLGYKEDQAARATAQYVIWFVLSNTMKLLHPFMPFLTEEIWQHLPHEGESLIIAEWPKPQTELTDAAAEQAMTVLMDSIKAIRNMRAEVNVPPGKRTEAVLAAATAEIAAVLTANQAYIRTLAASEPTVILAGEAKPDNAMAAVVNGVEVYLPMKGLIDVEKETARLNKEREGLEREVARVAGKLANESFVAKAPAEVIEKEKGKQKEYRDKLAAIEERLNYLAGL
jgi:valyl-tRNA synthetase